MGNSCFCAEERVMTPRGQVEIRHNLKTRHRSKKNLDFQMAKVKFNAQKSKHQIQIENREGDSDSTPFQTEMDFPDDDRD